MVLEPELEEVFCEVEELIVSGVMEGSLLLKVHQTQLPELLDQMTSARACVPTAPKITMQTTNALTTDIANLLFDGTGRRHLGVRPPCNGMMLTSPRILSRCRVGAGGFGERRLDVSNRRAVVKLASRIFAEKGPEGAPW